jgi:hypothetical protein
MGDVSLKGDDRMRWYGPIDDESWNGRVRIRGRRLVVEWARFLGRFKWEFLVTLTFDSHRVFPVDRSLADREAFELCKQVARATRQPVAWAYVVERGRGGLWHAHVLFVGLRQALWNGPLETWRNRNGAVDVRSVYANDGVALYTSKSMARDGEVVLADTLGKYRGDLTERPMVTLYPPPNSRQRVTTRR